MALRLPRLFLTFLVLLVTITLYIFYPSNDAPRSPTDPWSYEAGGIDSPHYRQPIPPPNLEQEAIRMAKTPQGDICLSDGDQEGCTPAAQQDLIAPPTGGQGGQQGTKAGGGGGLASWFGVGSSGKKLITTPNEPEGLDTSVIHGGVIMPKLDNATAKAELGRAAWKVLHLTTLRYPDNPTADDRLALKSYMHLFSRLYPCGECAAEFQALLKEYPPQTSSRKAASLWLCHVHNMVNARLGKPDFDCLTLDEAYDCGCGDEPGSGQAVASASGASSAQPSAKEHFSPPAKGQIGGKILGGKGSKAAGAGWKSSSGKASPAPSEDPEDLATTSTDGEQHDEQEAPEQSGDTVSTEPPKELSKEQQQAQFDEQLRQAEKMDEAEEATE